MKNLYSIILFFSIIIVACKDEKKVAVPTDLIAQDKFTQMLVDIRLLEGAYSAHYARIDSSDTKIEAYYLTLFGKHGVTKENFMSSYKFYALDQNKMLQIEEAVVQRLTDMTGGQQDTTKTNIPGV